MLTVLFFWTRHSASQQNALPAWHTRSTISGETMVADSLQPTVSNKQKEDQHETKVEQSSERDKERKDCKYRQST